MKINSYKKIGSNIYEVTLDNKKKIRLYDDIILKYDLLLSGSIDDKNLNQIIKDNNSVDAYYKSIKYIGIKMRTKKEIETYLKDKDYLNEDIDYTVNRLENEGYIDEKNYVDSYINDVINLKNIGPRKILYDLKKRGISESIIYDKLDGIDEEIWQEKIDKIINKKIKTNNYSEYIFKNKMRTNLLNSGFNKELIERELSKINIDDNDAFDKDADKIWNSLAKRYSDRELKYKFKNKMIIKGYKYEKINDYLNNK